MLYQEGFAAVNNMVLLVKIFQDCLQELARDPSLVGKEKQNILNN